MMTQSLGLGHDSVIKMQVLPKLATVLTMGADLFNAIMKLPKCQLNKPKILLSNTYIIARWIFNHSKGDHIVVIHGSHVQSGENAVGILIKIGSIPKGMGNRSTMSRTSSSTRSRHCRGREVLVNRWEFAESPSTHNPLSSCYFLRTFFYHFHSFSTFFGPFLLCFPSVYFILLSPFLIILSFNSRFTLISLYFSTFFACTKKTRRSKMYYKAS